MIWAAVAIYGVTPVIFLEGWLDSEKYCQNIEHDLLPFMTGTYGQASIWSLQQENVSIYRSAHTRNWLSQKAMSTVPWPGKSPVLNIIDNVWEIVARRLYTRGRQFDNVAELNVSIEEVWAIADADLLSRLSISISLRMEAVIDASGVAEMY